MTWHSRLILRLGESLKFEAKHAKGNLGQEEIESHSIVDQGGKVTGSVQYTEHMSIKAPFVQSLRVVQSNEVGSVVVDQRWNE
ncbi:hypothetical protein [Rhodoferax sp.]|uniref:hypothetical protein n=1 Tax=Rhodoferax sp. TaxID=50421 RepID=UPI0027538CC9|nr:hypothetical protein [Rhodoferax sp.]